MGSGDKKSGGVDPSKEAREDEVTDPEIDNLKLYRDRLIAGLALKQAETDRLVVS